jgi:hypothetical protein
MRKQFILGRKSCATAAAKHSVHRCWRRKGGLAVHGERGTNAAKQALRQRSIRVKQRIAAGYKECERSIVNAEILAGAAVAKDGRLNRHGRCPNSDHNLVPYGWDGNRVNTSLRSVWQQRSVCDERVNRTNDHARLAKTTLQSDLNQLSARLYAITQYMHDKWLVLECNLHTRHEGNGDT